MNKKKHIVEIYDLSDARFAVLFELIGFLLNKSIFKPGLTPRERKLE